MTTTDFRIQGLATPLVRALRAGGPDAHGQPAERHLAEGQGNPCRHCLGFVPEGAAMLILAHRPFAALQPYAESGPIFLCAGECAPWAGEGLPPALTVSPDYLVKAYGADERIRYGTGGVVAQPALAARLSRLLADPATAFVDIRSARNNCFQARAVRAAAAE